MWRWYGVCFLYFITPVLVTGQCLSRSRLYADFQEINTMQPAEKQYAALQKWLIDWQRCYPVADSTYVAALMLSGTNNYQKGNYTGAINQTKQVIPLYHHPASGLKREDLVKAYYLTGAYYNQLDNNGETIRYLQQAILVGKGESAAKRFVARSHLYLIYAFFVNGDYEKALTHADVGGQLALELKDTTTAAKILEQRGQVLSDIKRYDEAKTAIETAIRLLRKAPELRSSLAGQHRLLGTIYQKLGRPHDELAELLTAYEIAKACNHKNLSDFLNSLGNHFYNLKNYKQAAVYFQKGLDLDKSEYSKINLFNRLGLTHARLGNYPEAFRNYQLGFASMLIDYKSKQSASVPEAQSIRNIAQKDYLLILIQDQANTWLDWAKATHNNPVYLQNALKTYMLADTMIDYMRWEHTGQQSKLFWREKTHVMYERAIETCYLLGNAAQAFRFFEKSRAVLLADKLNELGARLQLPAQQMTDEKHLREQVTHWQAKLVSIKPGTLDRGQATEGLLTAQNNLDSFVKQLEKTNPAYYHYKYDNATVPLPMVQRWLKNNNTTLATYFVGDSTMYMLGVTPSGTRLIRQPIHNYPKLATTFNQLVANSQATRQQLAHLVSTGSQLYNYLLAPLHLPPGRVIISSDGFFLPFDAFSRTADKADFLVNYQAFSYAYSVSILVKSKEGQLPTENFLGVAPVQFHGRLQLATLSGSDKSLALIGNYFSAPILITKGDATRTAFLSNAPNCRVIQLFTHADADSLLSGKKEAEPILFFADSALKLSDLTNAERFRSELLVLSACKTGIGANQKGEGVFSLARGFASVGIPSIVTTLWSVENQPTYRLTELFHQYLADGLPKDIALQRAKQEFIRQGSKADELPSRWAGFILIGNAEPLNTAIEGWYWGILAFGGLCLLAIGGWCLRKRRTRLF